MKTLKLLFYTLLIGLATLTSCTNNDDVNVPDPQESASMQTTLDNLRTLYNEDGTVINDLNPTGNLLFDFCFEFVYPIELIYNNGSTVTVTSIEELIEILINQTDELYIIGIEFPFNVEIYNPDTNEVEIITIANEEEFIALLASCIFGDLCDCDDEYEPVCVEIEEGNQTIIIMFPNACYAECEGFTEDQYFECEEDGCDCDDEYAPVCVETPNGGIIEFDNECEALCEGYTPNDFVECEDDGCDCDDEYEPVCVQVGDGIIEFQNACLAECEGFTEDDFVDCDNDGCDCDDEFDPVCVEIEENGQIITITFNNACLAECEGFTEDDFVDCEGDDECEISELEVEVGECNDDGTYSLTIDFDYDYNGGEEFFDLYVRNNELIGFFALADLPLTIENFELSGYNNDYIKVCINDAEDCCAEIEWEAPDCDNDGGDCTISNLEVEVGECNPAGTYVLTLDFDYENTGDQQFFDLYVRNGEFIGYYELADLPLTIENFELSGYDDDYIKVCINDNSDCCAEIEWEAPDCNGDGDDCYEFVFPITMFQGGEAIEVNSNEEVDEYLALGWDLMYPINIIVNNEIITVMQGILEGAYGERCD